MNHFNVLRRQDGEGASAFSLFMQRFILIMIIYVIKIEGRKETAQVPGSVQ